MTKLDRLDLSAVLLALQSSLGLLVMVEVPLDPEDRPMEDIGDRPEEVVEVGFEARVTQGGDEGVKDVRHGAGDMFAIGQLRRIGLIRIGAPA